MDAMLSRLSALPEHSAVLFTTVFYYDAAGQYFLPDEALAGISARSTAPVYGTDEAFLGSGPVGGILYDITPLADTTGRIVQRVLTGDKPASISVETVNPNYPMFDARQLERWHIPKSRLPAGSVIRFEEIGTWARYKVYIVGAASLVVFQAALIVGLIVMSAKRQRAETSLRVSHVQIRDLAGRLITVQEQERSRIARELHDDVCQRMALLGMELTQLHGMLPSGMVDTRTKDANRQREVELEEAPKMKALHHFYRYVSVHDGGRGSPAGTGSSDRASALGSWMARPGWRSTTGRLAPRRAVKWRGL
jgi:signal transduction histidine kinase